MPESGNAPVRSLADAQPTVFWSDRPDSPPRRPSLVRQETADLVIVGGGFTGLWAAIQAKEQDPSRDVVLLEAETIGFGASGRNGGFVDASLTHGLVNGVRHFPADIAVLHRLGLENLDGIEATLTRHGVEADWDARGMLYVATQQHQLTELREQARLLNEHHETAILLDATQARAAVNSPTYQGGCLRAHRQGHRPPGPARLGVAPDRRVPGHADLRAHPGTPPGRRPGRGHRAHPLRVSPGGPGRRRHQRLPVAGAGHPQVCGPGL